ncbi:hypothetical protein [Rhizobium leguminosarum]|uniref:HMA domain-containing protein n=1 Tax=Rhizobium leguminosarum TaxID=384 RepID=A0A1B1C5W9_RHILE|nr:hypothetical protein [Rhizobium leguminosarum]ANP85188.1 hypothetical protein BA011_05160 [Rhizobium leguminosarum]
MTTDKIEVTIRIDKKEARSLGEVVGDLKLKGLEQVQSHERFMIVNGTVNPDALDALRAVKGVASVRKDVAYKPQAN